MIDQFKQAQRNNCITIRSKLSAAYQATVSTWICQRIIELSEYRQAKRIALYQAFRGEVDLDLIWKSAPFQGKYCYFPVIDQTSKLIFLPTTPKTAFKKNCFGIMEPDVDPALAIPIAELEIIFLPVVAFDIYGRRLGMGKGYYDKTLANQSCQNLIGLAYEFQKLNFIQPEPWDIPLSMIVTERQVYRPK